MALFEIEGTPYDLKMNLNKLKTVEAATGSSLIGQIRRDSGMLSLTTLETIFHQALYDEEKEKNVKGAKATKVFEEALEAFGYGTVVQLVVGKLSKDLGFMFRQG